MTLDRRTIGAIRVHLSADGRQSPLNRECQVAISDLLENNTFSLVGGAGGPYHLDLSLVDTRIAFQIATTDGTPLTSYYMASGPLRRIAKDYHLICESYHESIRGANLARVEAIDMARRGVHNDAAHYLRSRLSSKVEFDDATARRLFTLVYVLLLDNSEHRSAFALQPCS